MDFFTVITENFRILYCLFLISHELNESHLRRLAKNTSAIIIRIVLTTD